MKLTRKQTREALTSVPLDALLLGVHGAKQTKLTPRERRFAESVAMGNSKAQAYRHAVPHSVAKPVTQSRRGQELAKSSAVQAQIDALILAQEAQRHSTPAALRALVIQQLTEHAINPEVQPAQRLRALELLGKVTEVAAFTERREIVKTTDASTARSQLIDSLRSALKVGAVDAAMTQPALDATDLGAINPAIDAMRSSEGTPQGLTISQGGEAGTRTPLDQPVACAPTLLSNPDIRSTLLDETPPLPFPNEQGEGGINFEKGISNTVTDDLSTGLSTGE